MTVTRKRVKNINLRVDRSGNVRVSAPRRVSQSTIEEFVKSRIPWIKAALARVGQERMHVERSCPEGATVYLWGTELTVRYDAASSSMGRSQYHFEACDGELVVSMRPDRAEDARARDNAFDRWLRAELVAQINEVLPHCEQVVGRACSQIRIRKMTSRWGSCNTRTRAITLNATLVHFDKRCLTYVVIHELCHLHEPSHNERFHRLMDSFCPDWRAIRAQLNSKQ